MAPTIAAKLPTCEFGLSSLSVDDATAVSDDPLEVLLNVANSTPCIRPVLADSELSSLHNEKLAIRLSDSESEAVTTGTTSLVVVL